MPAFIRGFPFFNVISSTWAFLFRHNSPELSLAVVSEENQSKIEEHSEPVHNDMTTPKNAELIPKFDQLLKQDQITSDDLCHYLDRLQKHCVEENGYDDDDQSRIDGKYLSFTIINCMKANDPGWVDAWLQKASQDWPSDDKLPLRLSDVNDLEFFSDKGDPERFIKLQQRLCEPYTIGDHIEIKRPMLPPFYTRTQLGGGTFATVEAVEFVHDDGSNSNKRRYARKRAKINNVKYMRVLEEELKILRHMKYHHHVVQCVGSYRDKGITYILLNPHADKGNLSDYMNDMPLPNARGKVLKKSFGCLLSGLAFLSAIMRHKDIKPDNILVHGSNVLFTDFGSAYNFAKAGQSAATANTTAGYINRAYAAPEVQQFKQERDVKTDLFSLGCVFAEIIAVLSGTSVADFHQILKSRAEDSSDIRYAFCIDRLHKWLDELSDNKPDLIIPIGWCKEMTQENRTKRPKIPLLIERMKARCEETGELKTYFCSKCLEKTESLATVKEGNEAENNTYGLSPLSVAVMQGKEMTVKKLLEANANVNEKDPSENGTPLHWAIERDDPKIITLLLDHGAKTTEKDNNDQTALELAEETGKEDAVRLLRARTGNENSNSTGVDQGQTPLDATAAGVGEPGGSKLNESRLPVRSALKRKDSTPRNAPKPTPRFVETSESSQRNASH